MGVLIPIAIMVATFGLMYLSVRDGALAAVEITDREVVIAGRGMNSIWALRRSVRIAKSDILSVSIDVPRRVAPAGIRWPGTAVPGLITAGTYRRPGSRNFWLVGRARKVTVVRTRGHFDAVVLELSPSDEAVLAAIAPSPSAPIEGGL